MISCPIHYSQNRNQLIGRYISGGQAQRQQTSDARENSLKESSGFERSSDQRTHPIFVDACRWGLAQEADRGLLGRHLAIINQNICLRTFVDEMCCQYESTRMTTVEIIATCLDTE